MEFHSHLLREIVRCLEFGALLPIWVTEDSLPREVKKDMVVQLFGRPAIRRRVIPFAAACVAICGSLVATLPAGAAPSAPLPVKAGARYIALGDSLAFGYREAANLPAPTYNKAHSFVGYPEIVAKDLNLKLNNGSCPGETTGSMIRTKAASNGCEHGVGNVGPGYRSHYPLKSEYLRSQLDWAIDILKFYRGARLVTVSLGADDVALCQKTTADHCTSPAEISAMVTTVKNHMAQILYRLRQGALYKGQIVLVNDYSPNYADPVETNLVKQMNAAFDSSAAKWHAQVAQSFGAFQSAAAQTNGDGCAAGLLTILQSAATPCGAAPSMAGQVVLASAVEQAVVKS